MNFRLRGKGCCGGERPDKENVFMGAKCVCSMCMLMMDGNSSIHTEVASRFRRTDETAEKSEGDVAELCWVFLFFVCTAGPFRDGADQPHRAVYY